MEKKETLSHGLAELVTTPTQQERCSFDSRDANGGRRPPERQSYGLCPVSLPIKDGFEKPKSMDGFVFSRWLHNLRS